MIGAQDQTTSFQTDTADHALLKEEHLCHQRMEVQHIPAWKRLGLKLKFANDIATTSKQTPSSESADSGKRKTSAPSAANGSGAESHRSKKARLDQEVSPGKLNDDGNKAHSTPRRDSSPRRKKSVSFAPDTKIDDGDSAQTIQFWVPDSPGSTPMKPTTNGTSATPDESPKKPKREKKPKTSKERGSSAPPRKATAALAYLDQFYHQRTAWKFNKNHETWLLKHALSTEQIPSSHNLALAFYFQGLKSTAARQRLAEQSREALSSDNTDVTANDESSMKLRNLLDTHQESSGVGPDGTNWLNGMARGHLILLSLNEKVSVPGRTVNGQVLPKAKKNKSRTSRVEIESSSESSSDSGSENESESEDEKVKDVTEPGLSDHTKHSGHDEETSSSGSSTTSSEADSESEEESDSSSGSE